MVLMNTKDFFTLDDFDLDNKRVILRVDINSPINPLNGNILDDSRLKSHAVTIKNLSRAKLIILGHQSRPGKEDFTTMEKHAERLSYVAGTDIEYVDSLFDSRAMRTINGMKAGDAILLENTRFFSEEVVMKNADLKKMSKSHLVRRLASNADYFVIDCFGAAHRSQPSITGFSELLPTLAGRVMERELKMLNRAVHQGTRPSIGIFGGIKVDDSVDIIGNMLEKGIVDKVLTTGGTANLFHMADGMNLGKPSEDVLRKEVEDLDGLLERAKALLNEYRERIEIPTDFALNDNGRRKHATLDAFPSDLEINDIGLDTIVHYSSIIENAKTILMNGPAGVFEKHEFSLGTSEIFLAVANAHAFKVVGGGHTTLAMEKYSLANKIDLMSTGGGALTYFLAGKTLPAVDVLKSSKLRYEGGGYKKR
jgi:phosphoglycerate kinase